MQLHELISINKKSRPRVGRGGKRGTTSGRGQKGQKSRAGRRIRPASRDLIQRLPKRRGFKNKPKRSKPFIVKTEDLVRKIKSIWGGDALTIVNQTVLKQVRLLPPRYRGKVKIVGKEKISAPLAFSGIEVSESVKAEIEKAGGKVESYNANSANKRARATSK